MVFAALVLYMHTTLHNKCTGNHLYITHSTHTWQTHAHTPSSSCHHVLKDLGQDPGYCRRGRLGWRIAARHPERSMINSCQSVTPERSLLTTSHHRSGAPPGGLLLPLGWHFNTCFGCNCQASSRYVPGTVAASASAGLPQAALQFSQESLCSTACSSR